MMRLTIRTDAAYQDIILMGNDKKSNPLSFKIKIAIIALMSLSLNADGIAGSGTSLPFATSGVMDLSTHDLYRERPVRLDGRWQFFQGVILSPGAFLNDVEPKPTGYYPVPKYWTSYKGLSLSSKGKSSYRLLIHVNNKNSPLSLLTPEIFTEYRLFINGKLMDSHGEFSDGRIRFLSPRIFTFQNSGDTIEILLNIANYNHENAGIGQSFFLGSPEKIRKRHLLNTSLEVILVAVCLFAGVYHIILFVFRTTEKEPVYFGLFCMLIALRTVLTGTTLITQIMPNLSFEAGSRSATMVIPLCVMTFQTYAFHFFRPNFPVKLHRGLLMAHGIYLVMTLTLPPMIYSRLFSLYLLVILASGFLIIIVNGCVMAGGFRYAVIFFAGFLFVFAGVVNDMLHYLQVINTGYFLFLWFSFFIVAQSVMLAIKFSDEHKMVETLSKRLRMSDKLKDEFLANTSHELRTPINGIVGISDSLIDGVAGPLSEKAVFNLKLISSSAGRLIRLINDILDYSRLKNNDIILAIKDIDLRQITEVVVTIIKATSVPSENLELINDVGDELPFVRGDEDRLQQILFNLIGNAVKFTEKGQVRVWAQDESAHVLVHVEDTGSGIPADQYETIFRSFEQIDGTETRGHGGTGLGLPITKKLVELQGGQISVRSAEGKGSIFSFTLPKSSDTGLVVHEGIIGLKAVSIPEIGATDNPFAVVDAGVGDDQRTGEKILIVDDEATNIRVLQNYLALERYRFGYATNGVKAIEMISTRNFDLILLDIMMPRMSGYEVLRRIRNQYTLYELPVLMLTARSRNDDIVTAFQAGANDYLTKPIDRQELMVRIKTQLSLSHAVAKAIKNANLANTDELTGLYNRRFLVKSGNRQVEKAVLLNKPLSVIMLDIDFFKKINDSYGHAEGDKVLQHLAETIIQNIRSEDVAARYGGEEFVIILPGTTCEAAGHAAEKIRLLVEQRRVPISGNKAIRYTVSSGVASLSEPKCSFEDLLKDADTMLYQSKNEGRNKVSVCQ